MTMASPSENSAIPQLSSTGLGRRTTSNNNGARKTPSKLKSFNGDSSMKEVVSDWPDVNLSPKKNNLKKPAKYGDRYIARLESGGASGSGSALDANPSPDVSSIAAGPDRNRRILAFASEPPCSSKDNASMLLAAYSRPTQSVATTGSGSGPLAGNLTHRRRIATIPERVLDAPNMVDDYYLNLLDWSCGNLLAIALGASVYIWNAETSAVTCLCSLSDDDESDQYICSVKFSGDGSYLALGVSSGTIQIYDLESGMLVRTMMGHMSRISSLSWTGGTLSSGVRDGSIWNHDVGSKEHKTGEMNGHRGEVCGLTWRQEQEDSLCAGTLGLLASGGNDNIVNVWDGRMLNTPKMTKTNHTAAVKALAWCPWQANLLASGGGSSDKTVHLWNVSTSSRLNSLVTPSQVTSLVFNPHAREFMTTHGFPDMNLSIHTFPNLQKVIDIPQAHETRILHSALSPDGTVVATASSDENLKFWRVFESKRQKSSSSSHQRHAKESSNDVKVGRTTVIR